MLQLVKSYNTERVRQVTHKSLSSQSSEQILAHDIQYLIHAFVRVLS